jgi:hypothetical protein
MCLDDKTHNPHTTLNHHVSPLEIVKRNYKRRHGIALYTPYSTSNIRGKNEREEDHHTPNTRPHRSYRLFEKDRVYTIQEFFQIPRYIL